VTTTPLVGPQQVADRNRARILLTVAQGGPRSRADLARASGVTRTTIGTYVDRLIAEGLLEEQPDALASGGRGRPSRPVWFRADAARCGAVVFGRDTVTVGVVNARGELLDRRRAPADETIDVETLAVRTTDLLAEIGGDDPNLLGLGIAVSGMVDASRVVSRPARFPPVDANDLIARIVALTGHDAVVDNNSRAGALAELWWGHGREGSAYWTVQIGEGIGGGEVIDGEVLRGTRGAAGEIGHMTIDRHGDACPCGLRGCWETIASLGWLRRSARRRGLRGARAITPERLVDLASTDPEAAALLDEFADNLALGITNIVRLRDPSMIVLQGPVTGGGPALLDRVAAAVADRSLLQDHEAVELRMSAMGDDARLLGAGALVLSTTWALD
jgi:predicted NBD/HSP70 family sugar kinase